MNARRVLQERAGPLQDRRAEFIEGKALLSHVPPLHFWDRSLSWRPAFLYAKFHMGSAMAGLTATLFVQLASMVGSPLGGWLPDSLRKRTPRGRLIMQAICVFGGAPFVVVCGLTQSVGWLVVALTPWGLFKGLYDANIFGSVFAVVRPEVRCASVGFMNGIGWLAGGRAAPLVIGIIGPSPGRSVAARSLHSCT